MLLEQCAHQEGFQNNDYFQHFTLTLNNRYPYCLFFYQRLFYIHVSITISPTITTPRPTLCSVSKFKYFEKFLLSHHALQNPNPLSHSVLLILIYGAYESSGTRNSQLLQRVYEAI